MTCILTSLAGSECPGQTNQPGSEMPPPFQPGDFMYRSGGCMGQHLRGSCGCPQHMPAARQCKGSWSGLALSAKHPSLCRSGDFSGVSAQRTSVGYLLPCAMALAHLLSRSSLVWWGTASAFLVFWKGENCVPRGGSQFTGLWTLAAQRWK